MRAEVRVEGARERACELDVLRLVFADGHQGAAVQQDVGGLQDGVAEESEFERVFGEGGGEVCRGGEVEFGFPLGHA